MTYSLIIPIFNEANTLPALLAKLDKLNNNIEIIIIDDYKIRIKEATSSKIEKILISKNLKEE